MNLGKRGEGYVVIQFVLLALTFIAPRFDNYRFNGLTRGLGLFLLLMGLVIAIVSIMKLGQNLTALPHPKDNAQLVSTGIYALVRHPIYSALIFISFGWAIWNSSLVALSISVVLGIFLDLKSRREEHYLQQMFPDYASYKKRVKKFIPFGY